MIPEIGVMVGLYIVTRMVEMMAGQNRLGVTSVRVFGGVTVIVAVFTMIDLISRGTQGLPGF